jgi:hypothetical protein
MAFEKAKCDYLAGKWAKTKQLAAFPADVAAKTANFYVENLVRQVSSNPLEIRVANLCFESCRSLRDMQAESFNSHLRGISEAFSPKIKELAPPDVFQKNMAMNAAVALNWARLSGSRLCLLPYESTGHVDAGQKLLDAVDAAPAQTSEAHMRTVDVWAEQLSLRTLYRWELSNRRQ